MAYRIVPKIILTWFLLVDHRLILYSASSGSCSPLPGIYEKYDAYFEAMMSGFLPSIIIATFGCLILRNIRRVAHRRITPATAASQAINTTMSYIQQIDGQMTRMLLLQSFVSVPSFLPYGAQNLYSSLSENWYKSPLRLAWETMIIEIKRLFSYLFCSTSFFISLMSSRGFHRQVLQSLRIKQYKRRAGPANTLVRQMSTHNVH